MIIKDILTQLKTATHPVAKALYKVGSLKVLVIGFNKGMILKDHKTALHAKLTILSGAVIYREGTTVIILQQYDETDIPIDTNHSVECTEDALCLLTQG